MRKSLGHRRHLLQATSAALFGSGALAGCGPSGSEGPPQVYEATIAELQLAMEEGRTTAVELVDAYLARVDAYDRAGPELNAFISLNPRAREDAEALDLERAESGPRGPLHGIPIVLKDNFGTADQPTTAGSISLEGMVPPEDATVVRMLREAGAVILGKTNLHEFAYGYTSISSLGGQTRNPYDPARNPGGSSGGTGAAVSASFASIGYGTDTCGSIRVPAAFNGLFGIRPTKGLASVHGLIPLSHTQDTPGPLARTVEDLAIGLAAISGPDPYDSATLVPQATPGGGNREALRADALRGARIGVLGSLFGSEANESEVGEVVRGALRRMEEGGAEVVEVDLPGLDSLLMGTSVIAQEFREDLRAYLSAIPNAPVASLDEIVTRELHDPAIQGALRTSNAAAGPGSEGYQRALERRERARAAVVDFLEDQRLDALAYPSARREPALIGEPQGGINCQLSAATGLPALAAPAGLTGSGLPVGLELLGRPFDEARLLGLAYSYEQLVRPRVPPGTTPPIEQQY
jgi:Asp-tRNA(Asn)/Glu-tRNA(Gln) amidotransferase A subunit family amidase